MVVPVVLPMPVAVPARGCCIPFLLLLPLLLLLLLPAFGMMVMPMVPVMVTSVLLLLWVVA
jgi:hypothetical protein